MTFIFIILLFTCLAAFFGLGYFDVQITDNSTLMALLNEVGISTIHIQVLLGVGILFCQLGIILFSMLDRIGYALRAIAVPLLRLIPLITFLISIWRTYSPVFFNLLPNRIAEIFGVTQVDNYMAMAISDGTFTRGVVTTLVAMMFFVLFSFALRPSDSARVKSLKAENEKLRKQLRSL